MDDIAPSEKARNLLPLHPERDGNVEEKVMSVTETLLADPESPSVESGYYRHLLRSWGLSLVLVAVDVVRRVRTQSKGELKKVVVYHSALYFLFETLFHLIPLGIGIGLVSLNVVGYYVGKDYSDPAVDDSVTLVGYQIAAKLTELLCVASIAHFILAFVRHELISINGIPFGILSSSLDFGNVKYLWSREFWSLLLAPAMRPYRRILFFMVLGFSTILATLIGPTTAVLLQPRLEWWPAGGTATWIDTTNDVLFPTVIDSSTIVPGYDCETTDHENCPSAGWEILASWLQGLRYSDVQTTSPGLGAGIPSSGLTFTIKEAQVYPLFGLRPHFPMFMSTQSWMFVPNIALSRAFVGALYLWWTAATESQSRGETRFADYQDAFFSMIALAPGVSVRCNATDELQDQDNFVIFPLTASESAEDVVSVYNNAQLLEWISHDFAPDTDQRPRLHWIDGSWNGPNDIGLDIPGGFSGAALITLPGEDGAANSIVGCSMNTHYSTLTYHRGSTFGNPTDVFFGADTKTNADYVDPGGSTTTVMASWLNSLNPHLPAYNTTVFEQLMNAVDVRADGADPDAPYTNRLEALLLFMIGNGFSRMHSLTYPIDDVNDWNDAHSTGPWWRSILPSGATFGEGDNAYNVTAEVRQRAVMTRMYVAVYGYAYAYFDSSGSLWSAVIVLFYAAFALLLFVVLVRQGFQSSTSWGSITELNALVLGSNPIEDEFINTTAGIDTLAPLKRSVRAVERDGRVQIIPGDSMREDDTPIMKNAAY
jgi:hypothetical protein